MKKLLSNRRNRLLLVIGTAIMLLLAFTVTYAYLAPLYDDPTKTDVSITGDSLDKIIFTHGDPLNLVFSSSNLGEGMGSIFGETTSSATIIANETTNEAYGNYNIYLNIDYNDFSYTTPDKKPELVVEIFDNENNKITNIDGLQWVTVTDTVNDTTISGFDITNKVGRFTVDLANDISTTDSVNGTTETWTIKLNIINLDTDQGANADSLIKVSFEMSQRHNVLLNEIMSAADFSTTIAEIRTESSPLIDEMRFSNVQSADYDTATLKWDVSANPNSKEVLAYVEDHPTDGRILHIQSNGDVVFYKLDNRDYVTYLNASLKLGAYYGYYDEYGQYIPGSLTNREISAYCSATEVSTEECSEYFKIDKNLVEYIDLMNSLKNNYFSNVDYINMSDYVDTSNVIDMSGAFFVDKATKMDLSDLDTENVINMNGMFISPTTNEIVGLSALDTSFVTNMSLMFYASFATTLDLSSFDTSKVTNMSAMFYGSSATTLNLSSFNTSSVTDMNRMFYDSSATSLDLSNFDTSRVTNMSAMFSNSSATTLDLSNFDTSRVTNMSSMFSSSSATTLDLSNFDTSRVTNMSAMFYRSSATTLDLSSFDTSKVTGMSEMFSNSAATTLDLSNFDTSKVTGMSNMFSNSSATTLDLSSFNTSNVTTMGSMFKNSAVSTLDLTSFDTSNVTTMWSMFENSAATTLDLSSFDTSKVTGMSDMFSNSAATTLDLSSFNTSSVTTMRSMFSNSAVSTLDLSNFDTSNVTTMSYMFENSSATMINLTSFDFTNVTNDNSMLYTLFTPNTNVYVKNDADKTWLETNAVPHGVTIIVSP